QRGPQFNSLVLRFFTLEFKDSAIQFRANTNLTGESAGAGDIRKGVEHVEFGVGGFIERLWSMHDLHPARRAKRHATTRCKDVVVGSLEDFHQAETNAFGYFKGGAVAGGVFYGDVDHVLKAQNPFTPLTVVYLKLIF